MEIAQLSRSSRLLVEPEETAPESKPTTKPDASVSAWHLVGIGLQVLSTRVVALAGHSIALLALFLWFVLWMRVIDSPSMLQLIGLGLFAAASLLLVAVRR